MGTELISINQADIEQVTRIRDQLLSHEFEWRQSRRLFLYHLYEFAKKYRDSEKALDGELRRRKVSFNAASDYWDKVTKLIMTRELDGKWEVAEKSQVSKYALVLRGADRTGMSPDALLKKLEDAGIERATRQFRSLLKGRKPEPKKLDYISMLSVKSKGVAPSLLQPSHQVDLQALGLHPGKVELIGEVDENGRLQVRAIIPADEADLNHRLEKLYNERRPLERQYLELFDEILRLSRCMPEQCCANIKNSEKGVEVTLVGLEGENGVHLASISSPRFDDTFGRELDCTLDVNELLRFKELRQAYGDYARTVIKTWAGTLFLEVVPEGVETLDEANERMKLSGRGRPDQPKWVTTGQTRYLERDGKKTAYKYIKFSSWEFERIPFIKSVPNLTIDLSKADAAAAARKAKSLENQPVNLRDNAMTLGEDGITVNSKRLATTLTELRGLTKAPLKVASYPHGIKVTAKKRDYSWSVYLPALIGGRQMDTGIGYRH